MGKEFTANIEELEGLLGLDDEIVGDENKEKPNEAKGEDENSTPPVVNTPPATIITTEDQNNIVKDILKIDIQIEALENQEVDISDFYNNLEEELSEEEQQLEFTDKSAYMKAVAKKAKEFEDKKSPSAAIEELKATKKELTATHERQAALSSVIAKYPDFSYDSVFEFFDKKLTKEQQEAIYNESTSFTDVYEKAYLSYAKSNKSNIQQQEAPMIPDVNNVRRQFVDDKTIDDGLTSEEQRLKDALGL